MIKKALFAIFSGLFLLTYFCHAQVLTTSFEDCVDESTLSVCAWTRSYGTVWAYATDDAQHTGLLSAFSDNSQAYVQKQGTSQSGEFYVTFHFWTTSTASSLFAFRVKEDSAFNHYTQINLSGGISINTTEESNIPIGDGNYATSTWNAVDIHFDLDNNRVRARLNLGDWTDYLTADQPDGEYIEMRWANAGYNVYIDDIQETDIEAQYIYTKDPIFTPTFPPANVRTYLASTTLNATGTYEYPDDNAVDFDEIGIYLIGFESFDSYIATTTAGATSGTYDLQIDLAEGNYEMFYFAVGDYKEGMLIINPYLISTRSPRIYDTSLDRTIVSTANAPENIPVYQERIEWEEPDLDNCSALSGAEKWLCEIKNYIRSFFIPDKEKIEEMKTTIGELKHRFPFSYLALVQKEIEEMKEGSEATTTALTITLLDNSYSLDWDFLNTTTTFAGLSKTTNEWFYLAIHTFLICSLIGYFIDTGKRLI